MFANSDLVFPRYLADPRALVCPEDGDAAALIDTDAPIAAEVLIDDHSYFYLGYAVTNDAEMRLLPKLTAIALPRALVQ